MGTPRKPTNGLERSTGTLAGTPRDEPKEKPKRITTTDDTKATHSDRKNPKTDTTDEKTHPTTLSANANEQDVWHTVTGPTHEHTLRSDTQRKDILRLLPQMDMLIRKNKKANGKKIEQWIATKFKDLKQKINASDPNNLKPKDAYVQLRTVARNIGFGTLFETKKQPTPRKAANNKTKDNHLPPAASLKTAFEIEEKEFDLDSDISDVPDLDLSEEDDDDKSPPLLLARRNDESSSGSSIDLLADQKDLETDESDYTEGATFIIKSKVQLKNDDQTEDNKEEEEEEYEETDETTVRIEKERKKAENILDKEIEEIHLHTPNVRRTDSYEIFDFEMHAAIAIQNQMEERGAEMEIEWEAKRNRTDIEWDLKRKAMEQQCKETIEEQASLQVSIIEYETESARKEVQKMQQELSTANQALDEIRTQNLQKSKQNGQLQAIVADFQKLKKELKEESDNMERAKMETRKETAKINEAWHAARKMRQHLQEDVESTVQNNIQDIIDRKMPKIEQAIHQSLQKRGKTITEQAKRDIKEQIESQTQTLETMIDQKIEVAFYEGSTLLDQAVLKIGEEMEKATKEFREDLFTSDEMEKQIARLQRKSILEIRPLVEELHENLAAETRKAIKTTVREATDDIHISYSNMTNELETKINQYTAMSKLNAEALRTDLRQQAENLESEFHEKQQHQPHTPRPPPTTPERPNDRPETPSRNPYQRAPPVSPYHDINIPSEDTWNQAVRTCKEKVTLTYSLPLDVKELDQSQAEAFYRQIESNFKGYPAVKLHKFEALRRRGSTIPREYELGWPTEYVDESSTVLYEKLTESIPHTMSTLRSILMTHQNRRNGYAALMTIMKRSIPRLGQLPPKMEPLWPTGMTPTEYANSMRNYIDQQALFGRSFCDFEIAATIVQRACEHHEYYSMASNRLSLLVQMAANYDDFKDIPLDEADAPMGFATLLENYYQNSQEHRVNTMTDGGANLSINKFERSNQAGRRPPREGARDGKPRELCPCCLRHGHNVEKGSVCWMGAQVENVLKYNKDNPLQAKKNMENFKTALNPATIKKMQLRFPAEFEEIEPDSLEMLEHAVELFEMFQRDE